jgi:hypothetical protein
MEPCLGQLPENSVDSVAGDCCNVLQHDVAGSNCANDSHELKEKPASSAVLDAGLLACGADVLAGEAGRDDVGCSVCGLKGADVMRNRYVRPMLAKNGSAKRFAFNKLNSLVTAKPARGK